MKKLLTSFLLIIAVTSSGWAQTQVTGTYSVPNKSAVVPASYKNSFYYNPTSNTRYSGSQWYSYFNSVYAFLGGSNSTSTASNTYLFPDTSIVAVFGSASSPSYGTPFVHSIATVLDPKSIVFQSPTAANGSMLVTAADAYNVDSIELPYGYFRFDADTTVVDTLVFNAFTTTSLQEFYFSGSDILTNFGQDTLFFGDIIYDSVKNKPVLSAPSITLKLPLNQSSLADTVAGGAHLLKINTSSLGTIPAGGLVGAEVHFIPGYSYSLTDTLNRLNYLIFSSLDEIPGSYPVYNKGDLNQSFIINNQLIFNDAGSFNGFYLPTDAFPAGYSLDDHQFAFQLTCASCFGVGVKNVNASSADVNVYPNPTSAQILARYELTNTSDVTIEIKDLSGRTVSTEVLHGQNSGLQQHSVDVSNFTSGVYFCSVITNDGIFTKKFIINK